MALRSCELLVTISSSTNQSITLFYVCFCLKMPHLIPNVGALTPNVRLNEAPLTDDLLCKSYHSLPTLGHKMSPSALGLGAILNREITSTKYFKKCKRRGRKQTTERVHACGITAETRRQSSHLSWEHARWVTNLLCVSCSSQESTQVFDLQGGWLEIHLSK